VKAAYLALLLVVLFPIASRSQSPFDGTWIVDPPKSESLAATKPITFSVVHGMFRDGYRVIKADGKDQEVPVTGYWDTVSVRIVDDHTVEVTSKKAGKPT